MKLTARRLSGQAIEVEIENGRYARITPSEESSEALPFIAPGLIDIQVNGFAGVDFNRALESDEAWEYATAQLLAHGCTGFLIALITNRRAATGELLAGLVSRIKRAPRNCLGFHMEGPWLNPGSGYRGAHRAEWMTAPDVGLLGEWRALAGPLLRLITLAPEINDAKAAEVMRAGTREGVRFFIGHSGAMGETLDRAVAAGAVGWTHLGNAAPSPAPKFDNVILHALAREKLVASLIPDGLHLPPHAFRVLARVLDASMPSRLLLTTDAMSAAAAADALGRYTLGEIAVEVGADGSARLPTQPGAAPGRLAGSTLTPFVGVLRAAEMSGLSRERVWAAFSTRPAEILGLAHDLVVGHSADFCLLTPEERPALLATHLQGIARS